MSRLTQISDDVANTEVTALFGAVKQGLGLVPNMTRAMANEPAVLNAYLGFSGALGKGTLDPKTRHAIALVVAAVNGCNYCASAHSAISGALKVDAAEITSRLAGQSADARTQAVLTFAKIVAETRGMIADADISAIRAAGFDDAGIAEITAHVALNFFTNLINNVADTDIDFPVVTVR